MTGLPVRQTEPPSETATIASFRRGLNCTRITGAMLITGVAGLLASAVALAWGGGVGWTAGIGLSVVTLIAAMRLGVWTNTRHLELMGQSPRREDLDWLRAWTDLSPNIACLVCLRLEDGELDMDTLYNAWCLARAEGVFDPTGVLGVQLEEAERVRQNAHDNLARVEL